MTGTGGVPLRAFSVDDVPQLIACEEDAAASTAGGRLSPRCTLTWTGVSGEPPGDGASF